MKFCITLLIGVFGLCLHTGAQETVGRLSESQIALLWSDIQTKKTDILAQNWTPSDLQANKFWPLQISPICGSPAKFFQLETEMEDIIIIDLEIAWSVLLIK